MMTLLSLTQLQLVAAAGAGSRASLHPMLSRAGLENNFVTTGIGKLIVVLSLDLYFVS
jgi:hypothetical protein